MIETINNLNPKDIIKSEESRHSTSAKRSITKIRERYREEDISIIKKHFPNIKTILCIGARDDSEITSFINNGFDTIGIDVSNETKLIKKIDAHKLNEYFTHFDLIYSSHSLEHLYNPSLVLSNIRNLKPKVVYIILPLQSKAPSFKHPSKFEIMKINNQYDSIIEIEKNKKDYFENPKKYENVWSDFNQLKPFSITDWKFRDGLNMKEKEILFCLTLKYLD